jgi:crossover junction endodeoxyribonuclease RuvC
MRAKNVDKSVCSVDLVRRDFVPAPGSRTRPLVMGIDPGLNGAIAVVDVDSNSIVDMIDMPTFKKPSKARKQGFFEFVDVHQLSSLIDAYSPFTALAVLEEPGAMPNQGLSSTFRFGHICGQIHGVLAGHYIPVCTTKPGVWKSALALTTDKDDSRELASKEFPAFTPLWALKKHNDRAEAALLTLYAKKYLIAIINMSRK